MHINNSCSDKYPTLFAKTSTNNDLSTLTSQFRESAATKQVSSWSNSQHPGRVHTNWLWRIQELKSKKGEKGCVEGKTDRDRIVPAIADPVHGSRGPRWQPLRLPPACLGASLSGHHHQRLTPHSSLPPLSHSHVASRAPQVLTTKQKHRLSGSTPLQISSPNNRPHTCVPPTHERRRF